MLRLGLTAILFLSTPFLTSCLDKMPTEPILLMSQLCSDCGQWSAAVLLLCHRHNQNSLRPVSLLSPKLYFSRTFRAALLLPSPLTYPLLWMKRDWERGRESEDDDIQYKMLSPIELLWKAPFLSVYTEADAFENMFVSYGVSFIPAFSHTCSTYTPIQCVHWKSSYFLPFHASYNMIPSWSVLNRLSMSENQFDQNVFCCVKQWSILFSVISFCYFCQTTVINF